MRKYLLIGVLVLVLVSATVVSAQVSGPADQDGWASATLFFDSGNAIVSSNTFGGGGVCDANAGVAVVSVDFSSPLTQPAATATLTMNVVGSSGSAYPVTLGLYEALIDLPDDDTASGGIPTWVGLPTGPSLNSTVTLPGPPPAGPIVFPTSPEFVAAAEAARTGDQRLTVVIQGASGCTGSSTVQFGTQENGNGGSFLFLNPTSVNLLGVEAGNGTQGLTVIWIGAAILSILVGGVLLYSRRSRGLES